MRINELPKKMHMRINELPKKSLCSQSIIPVFALSA